MKTNEIQLLIKEGEGLTVEFKERYSSKIDRDMVAFANTKGGVILLGVSDEGKIVDTKLTNRLKAEISDLARKCDPQITIKKISHVDNVIAIEILQGEQRPYSCSAGYYLRLDAISQKMTQREVRAIFRETEDVSFEDLSCRGLSFSDLSLVKIKNFLKEAKTSYKINKDNVAAFLTSLKIYRDRKINNVGALAFASKVDKFIPHAQSVLLAFKGTDKTNIYDRKDVKDDLLTQFNEAISFLEKHLNIRSEIRGVNRFDIYEIPIDALREAVVNSLVHRDYAMKGTSLYVRVFDDRVEIENPGGLPDGLQKKDFGKSSIRRNPIIADLFHRMDKVEEIGSGIDRMRSLMKEANLKEPVFEINTLFRTVFYRDPEYALKREEFGEKVRRKGSEKSSEKIIGILKGHPSASAREIANMIGISSRAVEKHLANLKDNGLIKRVGADKGGYWEVF